MVRYNLYLAADQDLAGNRQIERIVEGAVAGGVTVVQLRAKKAGARDIMALANRMHPITKKAGVPLIVNDRIDIALAIDAEGAHVGQSDLPAALARKILGPRKILGVSVKTVSDALRAQKDGADYLGVGDIFGTRSKKDAGKPIGLEAIRRIARRVRIPVIGIGGISAENAYQVIEAGADGIAVISALVLAPNPAIAAQELRAIIDASLRK
ncbi:thiamine-phosphate diphosphorylase [Candidatus Kaiserbacteria bacterium RIFCSPHIGHO2_02_FULL_49_16]|uniref:Thiamine-phosphate synthase n=1 Tax=Candidatus Kaiserbacteria bacterium RIFCSPHIGHO2_02_FULL_49_16 TaxID=1798490 RepID=A0A1F6DHG9_9BACT|nr:MAG: thiamine-phosphate diphosphorylase [Candidatus Kaiserbacteria bacterium RIFCSPHIGHO2_02_FULL_49_16]